jgi:hypothetical protein
MARIMSYNGLDVHKIEIIGTIIVLMWYVKVSY